MLKNKQFLTESEVSNLTSDLETTRWLTKLKERQIWSCLKTSQIKITMPLDLSKWPLKDNTISKWAMTAQRSKKRNQVINWLRSKLSKANTIFQKDSLTCIQCKSARTIDKNTISLWRLHSRMVTMWTTRVYRSKRLTLMRSNRKSRDRRKI